MRERGLFQDSRCTLIHGSGASDKYHRVHKLDRREMKGRVDFCFLFAGFLTSTRGDDSMLEPERQTDAKNDTRFPGIELHWNPGFVSWRFVWCGDPRATRYTRHA